MGRNGRQNGRVFPISSPFQRTQMGLMGVGEELKIKWDMGEIRLKWEGLFLMLKICILKLRYLDCHLAYYF